MIHTFELDPTESLDKNHRDLARGLILLALEKPLAEYQEKVILNFAAIHSRITNVGYLVYIESIEIA